MKTYQLAPADGHKSFYNKCHVEDDGVLAVLISYQSQVASYNHQTNRMVVNGWHSHTTARHINAFLAHFGFDTVTKAKMKDFDYWNK